MLSNSSSFHGLLRAVALLAWVFAGFMLAQATVIGVLSVAQAAGVPLSSVSSVLLNSIGNVIIYGLAIAIVVGVPWVVAKKRTTLEHIGLHRLPSWKDILLAPAGVVLYFILTVLLTALAMAFLPFIDYTQVQETGFAHINGQFEYVLAFISLVVVAPFAEEVLFRGYLFGKLRRYASVWAAGLLTSLLFAVVHFQWNVGLDVFALSVVLCALRVVSGSLWPSIMVHMVKNGIAFYFLFVNPIVAITIGG